VKERCDQIREKLEDMLSRDLPPAERDAVDHHLAGCPDCRDYLQSLRNDDEALDAFAASMQSLGSRIQDAVFQASEPRGRVAAHEASFWSRPAVRVAAAAAVIAAIVFLSTLFDSSPRQDVVWASVFKQVEDAKGYFARGTLTEEGRDLDVVIYDSPIYGYRQDLYSGDSLVAQVLVDFTEERMYSLQFDDKTFTRIRIPPNWEERLRERNPQLLVRRMMGREHEPLGHREIDGIMTSGIEVVDTVATGVWRREQKTRVFVEIGEQWPVLIEYEISASERKPAYRFILFDFQWQPDLSPSDFTVDVPDDFIVIGVGSRYRSDAESAMEGLRNFAAIAGRFPESLDIGPLRTEVSSEIENLKRVGLHSQAIADSMDTVVNAGLFYAWAGRTRGYDETVYHGKTVSPADSGKVLLRWRLVDYYAVIFSELRYQIVDSTTLAELEERK
jgi:hypothetical protein